MAMPPKPKIQYVGYVYGSEARKLETEQKPKTRLPKLRLERFQKLYIDPFAVVGLIAAAVLLAILASGAVRLSGSWEEYNRMSEYLSDLKRENARLSHTYHTSYNPEEIREMASAYGMIDAADAQQYTVLVYMPEKVKEPTAWDDFVWFFTGLFAGATEGPTTPEQNVTME